MTYMSHKTLRNKIIDINYQINKTLPLIIISLHRIIVYYTIISTNSSKQNDRKILPIKFFFKDRYATFTMSTPTRARWKIQGIRVLGRYYGSSSFSFFFFRGKAKPHPLGSWESKDESQRAWESSFEERSNLLRVTRESFGAKKLLRDAGICKAGY